MPYAFSLDASACSGCKACQEACKDKNNLPAGVLWRRVVEVSGGGWQPVGDAWQNSVFAYNLSLACNHCTHPKCAGVCPTDAYTVRPDGVVLLDTSRCMGCGYCAWACPYSAPQFDPIRGIMTKCDFCYDYLDEGLPPSCVAACPLRVLEFGEMEALAKGKASVNLWQLPGSDHPYPLPEFSRTEPHLSITLHPGMSTQLARSVSNREEVLPPGSLDDRSEASGRHELPLVAFTLLTQMAAGLAWVGLITPLPMMTLLSIGILLALGGFVSFLHLGRKRNAWRAVGHLRKSWLSREVLMAGLFGAAWAVSTGMQLLSHTPVTPWPMAILGLGLVYSMSRVYLLRAVPAWNTWRTLLAFFLTSILLGTLGINIFKLDERWLIPAGLAFLVEIGTIFFTAPGPGERANKIRLSLLSVVFLGFLFTINSSQVLFSWLAVLIFLFALAAEVIGRWQFYTLRVPFLMRK